LFVTNHGVGSRPYLLTTFITPIAIFSSYELYVSAPGAASTEQAEVGTTLAGASKTNNGSDIINLKIFLISLLLLESLQICAFVSLDLLLFYIFFESAKWSWTSLLCFSGDLCLQLPNSGDALKILIPSRSLKAMSGWTNHSGKVTSQKISEKKMGNRGSKSDNSAMAVFVKEQRVDGNNFGSKIYPKLRCTLMGCESNYPISNPSKQFIMQTRSFYTHSKKLNNQPFKSESQNSLTIPANVPIIKQALKLNPWWRSSNRIYWCGYQKYYSLPTFATEKTKSLVIYGSNLSSTVGIKFNRTQLAMVKLASYQYSVIIGLLLSDGWLTIASKTSKNARLGFQQSLAKVRYILFVFNILSHYCSNGLYFRKGIRLGNNFYSLSFFTRSMACFTELHSLFYPNGVKIIPHNIYDLLTPIALAHMIMGDGSAEKAGLKICTDSYSIEDIVRLINVLIIKYRLECTIREHKKNQYRIYIKQRSMPLLREIVLPYFESSMLYKIRN
jgi:LAGLIDADG DNA endonuclease family